VLVLHIIDDLKVGGAQTQLTDVLREATRSYSAQHLVLSLFSDGKVGDDLRALGIRVEVLDLKPLFLRRRFWAASGIIEKRIRELAPAIVEAHLTWSRLLGLYSSWRAGVGLRIAFEPGDIYLNSWKFRVANFIGQFLAHHIVVCSKALAEWDHRTYGFLWRRMTVLHSCVDTDHFSPERHNLKREQLGFTAGPTLFCAAGTMGKGVNKRIDICIKAIASARAHGADVVLVICGDGEQRSELERLVTALKLNDYIQFLGMRSDLAAVFGACDAFCHATAFEPFGCVCVDAMAMGLPILVPDKGGSREAVDNGVSGFIYPALDHEALASAMCDLHEQPKLRAAMGRSARRAAVERFSVGEYVRNLYQIYQIHTILKK